MYSAVFLNCVNISDILCVTIFLCNAKGCSIANFKVICRLQFWAMIFLLKDTKVQNLDCPISIVSSEFWPFEPHFLFRWNIFRNLVDQSSEAPINSNDHSADLNHRWLLRFLFWFSFVFRLDFTTATLPFPNHWTPQLFCS